MHNHFHCNLQILVLCVSVHRQASLNEAAERYYVKAADLRPDVSTFFRRFVRCLIYFYAL